MSWEVSSPIAAEAPVSERVQFIRRTYAHLAGAILAFVALETVLITSPFAEWMIGTLVGSGTMGMLALMVAFVGAGWIAEKWAASGQSTTMQYVGLGLYVVAEAVIFVPLLYISAYYSGQPNIIAEAGIYTLLLFTGLTVTVFTTKADFSWMRGALAIGGMAAIGTIVCSMIFGFTLGTVFSGLMVALASGYVLYYTSNVLNRYPVNAHVAAALALFAAIAMLFYYILRLLNQLRR